ncbi:MAG: ABC transporter ATP-binding protein [Rhodospirillaceae bacterium]|nr:ABC transporter ATP-binding protein [Rhodospirillaceae bacterium]|tara:strand:- start:720 stop:2084 length:1365 start_codon:yes stop_codon:yes gene_type:complete
MEESEDNRIGRRMRRYAQVGGTVGGLATRFAATKLFGLNLDSGKHASELEAALGSLKGPLMKAAQLLATIPDALPSDYGTALAKLQSNAPSMGWPFVRRRMATELGPDWQARFHSFERQAAHAASLGQVHKAQSHEGKALACKLQYPDMGSIVEADLTQLRLLFSIYERGERPVSTSEIHAEISDRLREELDYGLERRHMALYGEMLEKEQKVHVPEAEADLSTNRLLSMSWLTGQPLLDIRTSPLETRNAIARNMFHAWYVPFYKYGVIHGDPHLGNYTVCEDQSINLLDFGCVRIFPPTFVKGVIDLYLALKNNDHALAIAAYESWGFKNISKELIDVLNIWAEFVYAPLLKDSVSRIQDSESGMYGAQVANKVHNELRRVGGVTPPREFVFMDRAAIGLGSVFMHLKSEINWHRLFHELIEGFDLVKLTNRQTQTLTKHGVSLPIGTKSAD